MTQNSPESPSGLVPKITNALRQINEQLQPQDNQPLPFQRTTLDEDLARINKLSGPPRQFGEIVADIAAVAEVIRDTYWPFPRP